MWLTGNGTHVLCGGLLYLGRSRRLRLLGSSQNQGFITRSHQVIWALTVKGTGTKEQGKDLGVRKGAWRQVCDT